MGRERVGMGGGSISSTRWTWTMLQTLHINLYENSRFFRRRQIPTSTPSLNFYLPSFPSLSLFSFIHFIIKRIRGLMVTKLSSTRILSLSSSSIVTSRVGMGMGVDLILSQCV